MKHQAHNTPQSEYLSVLQSAECRKGQSPSCFDVISDYNTVTVFYY